LTVSPVFAFDDNLPSGFKRIRYNSLVINIKGGDAIITSLGKLEIIESIRTSLKIVICSKKIKPKFDGVPTTDFLQLPKILCNVNKL